MRGDRAEMSDFPLYLNTVAGGLDRRDQTIGDRKSLVSVAKHWGTYGSPYRNIRRNQNGLLEVTYKPEQIRGWSFTLAGAVDGGNMLGESWGGMLTIRKTGLIGKKK